MHLHAHDWCHPLDCLHSLAAQYPTLAFLYSGLKTSYSGDMSWLGFDAIEQFEGDDPTLLRHATSTSHATLPSWFGYLSYEFGRTIPTTIKPSTISLPKLRLTRFRHVLQFDHVRQTIRRHSVDNSSFDLQRYIAPKELDFTPPHVTSISSNMNQSYYRQHIEETLEAIRSGSFYQANITRKFMGRWGDIPSREEMSQLFHQLSYVSPAPYSAFITYPDTTILSSSPEQFLKIDADGTLTTRPIKGTSSLDNQADTLASSLKNRAENLMIVDLMRNDFAKVTNLGSVRVPHLFEVDNFKTLRHLSSTITGKLRPDLTIADAILACFPAGSMTGAPKQRVIQWCEKTEGIQRGVYSGAIGWLSRHTCEFSVVIRTLIAQNDQFEFQVGGGIVNDSDAYDEWEETMTKSRGIAQALGIHLEDLRNI